MSARLEDLDDVEDSRGVDVVDHVADVDGAHRTLTMINTMDERASQLVSVWLRGLSVDARLHRVPRDDVAETVAEFCKGT